MWEIIRLPCSVWHCDMMITSQPHNSGQMFNSWPSSVINSGPDLLLVRTYSGPGDWWYVSIWWLRRKVKGPISNSDSDNNSILGTCTEPLSPDLNSIRSNPPDQPGHRLISSSDQVNSGHTTYCPLSKYLVWVENNLREKLLQASQWRLGPW